MRHLISRTMSSGMERCCIVFTTSCCTCKPTDLGHGSHDTQAQHDAQSRLEVKLPRLSTSVRKACRRGHSIQKTCGRLWWCPSLQYLAWHRAVGSDMWHQTRHYLIRLFSFGLQALLLKNDLPADASANCQGSHMSINSHPDRRCENVVASHRQAAMSNFSYSRSQQLGEQQEQNILGHGAPPTEYRRMAAWLRHAGNVSDKSRVSASS